MLAQLICFLRNPRGWVTVQTIVNELRSEHGAPLGTYVFQLQIDRWGSRRYRAQMQHGTPVNLKRHAQGPAIADYWVRHGQLPI